MSDHEMPQTIDDVPGWLREHARSLNMRVLFVLAHELDAALCDRADVEAEAWNAGATVVDMPNVLTDAGAELFRSGAFAMLRSIDRARAEAEAGNAFAAGYLAELTGAPTHDYEMPAPLSRSVVQHPAELDRTCNEWHGYTHDQRGDYVCPGYPHPLSETVGQMHERTRAVSAGELPPPPGVPTTFTIPDPLAGWEPEDEDDAEDVDAWAERLAGWEPEDEDDAEDVDAWAERTGYAALHDERYGYTHTIPPYDPAAPGLVMTELPDDEPAAGARGLGRLLGRMFTTTAPERPRCPHCGDRFRTHSELSTHVRDTGDVPERPAHACPVLWRMRHRAG